ncbi:MAG: YidH family protein [Acidimicrobiia bacterium]
MDASSSEEPSSELSPSHDTGELALQRTSLAAERTLFAVLRTGLAIAAGGSVIVSLLGDEWPDWVQIPLAAVFLVTGYGLVFQGLDRYRSIARQVKRHGRSGYEIVSPRSMTAVAWALEIAIAIVVILFLLGAWESADALAGVGVRVSGIWVVDWSAPATGHLGPQL